MPGESSLSPGNAMASPGPDQPLSLAGLTPASDASSRELDIPSSRARSKRPSEGSLETPDGFPNRRKASKVSRACDYCKGKKLKCTGTIPCSTCTKKNLSCQYDAQYRRGKPPKPVSVNTERSTTQSSKDNPTKPSQTTRISPGLGTAEIQGQLVDSTSNLTFIHRAWKKLALQSQKHLPNLHADSEQTQPLMQAGDRPFTATGGRDLMFANPASAEQLFEFYFENCVVTYRLLNRQQCLSWFQMVLHNFQTGIPLYSGINHAKAAIIVNILAIASLRQSKTQPSQHGQQTTDGLQQSEQYFGTSMELTGAETGLPRLESVQARLLQVLYLLQSSRMNQAWYVFGCTVPIVSALGLHRKSARHKSSGTRTPNMDYITFECRKRVYWVSYTIDKYLSVVFGRPRFYHSDDVDQDFPERVNDDDMTAEGPSFAEPQVDCHIDSLIFHAKIAQFLDETSREVYSLRPMSEADRLAAAQRLTYRLHAWRRELPPYLGTVRPSSLIPIFGRQATALKLAYFHAVMHVNRPFLLDQAGGADGVESRERVTECIEVAKAALETIDAMFSNKAVPFCILWWTPYVTFCALAVVYVWEIQQKATQLTEERQALLNLAERCQSHLTKATSCESVSHRYSIIIEELRIEARHGSLPGHARLHAGVQDQDQGLVNGDEHNGGVLDLLDNDFDTLFEDHPEYTYSSLLNPLSQWQATDWLQLDSSAFGLFAEMENEAAAMS
ncbi:fungal-specific transcription factor domain-containing protein [Stachybotrys elegans]|uniref:Fungal-specific transcription factor domain-containing protein n=1 Tax=Stachybotrys elegans TaxID=80388 RepID=A0A8K0SQH7_9HYPO|nr:fungal-specific transcription factor domain-containing protein [Stachybotrys elegans]